ncbi:MAG TPA: hypothetical protein VIO58_09455 [Candidatus Methanoperedens sp.]
MTEHRILSRPLLVHLLFQAVAADTGTPHNASQHCTSLLFVRKQLRTAGFSPWRTWCHYCFFYVLVVILSLLCFEARVANLVLEKRGIGEDASTTTTNTNR